jgi:fibronectin-binding autotransporter adhesin
MLHSLPVSARLTILSGSIAGLVLAISPASNAQLNFDINGATAGSGTPAASQPWNTGTNWTSDSTGSIATSGWINGSAAIFSAGTEAAGTWGITISGTIQTNSITFNGGTNSTIHNITLGTIDAGANPLIINSSAAGITTGRSKTISSAITGTGGLQLALNGDMSATGGSSNTLVLLNGANTFSGGITITSGLLGTGSNFGNASNTIALNGGGLVDNNVSTVLSRNITIGASGGTLRAYGSANLRLAGTLSGSGAISKTDGGIVSITGDTSAYTGAITIGGGSLAIGDNGTAGSLQTAASMAINSSGTNSTGFPGLHIRRTDTVNASAILPSTATALNVTFGGADSNFVFDPNAATAVLNLDRDLGSAATAGRLRAAGGTLNLVAGTDVIVNTISVGSQSATNRGTLNIVNGSTVQTRFIDIGAEGSNSGTVNQSGGTVTVQTGSSGFRLGHWTNGANPANAYNLTGGTLNTSAGLSTISWDGAGTMTIGGGASTATWQVGQLNFDGGGADTAVGQLILSVNGLIETNSGIGASNGVGEGIYLNGGTMKAMVAGTWNPLITANASTASTIETNGVAVTVTNDVSGTGTINLAGAGSVIFDTSTNSRTVSPSLTGAVPITKSGTGTLNLTGNSAYSGTISHNAGTLSVSASYSSATVNVADGAMLGGEGSLATFTLGATTGGIVNVDGATAGALAAGSVTINPGGFVSLLGAPATSGPLTVFTYGGTLAGFGNLSLQNATNYRSAVIANPAGSVTLDVGGQDLVWNGTTGGEWDLNTSSRWNAGETGKFFWADRVTFNDTGVATAVTLAGDLRPANIVVNSATNNYAFTGGTGNFIGGGATLLKRGTSTLAINAPNTFTGGTTLSEGIIRLGNVTGAGTGAITIGDSNTGANTPTLLIDTTSAAANLTVANSINIASISGTTVVGSALDATDLRIATYSGTMTLADDVILRTGADDQTTFSGKITGTGNISIENGTSLGDTGGGNVSNRVIWSNATNDFVGNITVKAGLDAAKLTIFQVNNGEVVPNNANVAVESNAVFRLNANETINNLTGTGLVRGAVAARTLTVGANNGSSTFDGILQNDPINAGTLVLTKAGTGTLTLTGANTHTGATNVNAGTLQIGNGGSTGSLAATATSIAAGATITYNRTGAVTHAGALNSAAADAGTLNIDGGVELTLGVGGNFSGIVNILNGSKLIFGATNPVNSAANPADFILASGTTLSNTGASNHGHVGNISLNGATWTTGSGTGSYDGENYQLNGNVTVTGSTPSTISREASRTDANSGVSLNGQRTFTVNNVTGDGATDLFVSAQLEARDSGVVGGLTKEGLGTVEFGPGPVHNYAGPTTVNAGTVLMNAVLTGSATTVNGGTLGGIGTLAATTIAADGSLSPGLSIGTLNFSSTLTLAGTANLEISKLGLALSADLANVTGLLTLGGTLNVTAAGDALAEGDSFNLFDAGSFTGNFAAVNLPALGAGLSWDTSGLPGGGDIVVVPEPSAALAIVGGTALLLGLRRRRS